MPRKKRASLQRDIQPDRKYQDRLVSKLINQLMQRGKKSVAEHIVYGCFDLIAAQKRDDPLKLFRQGLENVKPVLEVRSRRVGGANYQVPVEVRSERRLSLGLRWMIGAARDRNERTMEERLAAEILEAVENRGGGVRKREETHRMAEANKAFAHFRW
ncbi:MAG: 30S ribosomal protein S7 [Deltaproteobacteria bacterium]|nr:30S ribosomal protein S7 [Deltaproteobacteria bacterium]